MRIYAAQLNFTVGDLTGNTAKIIQAIEQARSQNADIVLFSELAICGYPPEDLLLHPLFIKEMQLCLEAIIKASKDISVIVGLARSNDLLVEKPIFNSAAVISNQKLLGFQDKMLLPTYDVFSERRFFEPGQDVKIWDLAGGIVAVLICEDIWQHAHLVSYTHYALDPVAELKQNAPDVLLNLSASPFHLDKAEVRLEACKASALSLRCPVVMCCQVGGNDGLVFDGHSMWVDRKGHLLQIAKGFQEDGILCDLSEKKLVLDLKQDSLNDLYSALVLGLRDYFTKCGFRKACLGLSGGIDSALTACIAKEALGKENVLGIAMPSKFNSPSSLADAKQLADNLGIGLEHISIESLYEEYLISLEPIFKGREADITEENLQARIRGMLLMAVSNKMGCVVVSTSNKSEMALGYCTLYGDMCGGLAVIGDLTKTKVYELSHFVNRNKEIIPISTLEKAPSAELKPNQKDTDSLPDYAIVDAVLRDYVENFFDPLDIAEKNHLPLGQVMDLIRRIHRAEFKRRQAPPIIRVTQKSFGKGRQYPIAEQWI